MTSYCGSHLGSTMYSACSSSQAFMPIRHGKVHGRIISLQCSAILCQGNFDGCRGAHIESLFCSKVKRDSPLGCIYYVAAELNVCTSSITGHAQLWLHANNALQPYLGTGLNPVRAGTNTALTYSFCILLNCLCLYGLAVNTHSAPHCIVSW